MSDSVVDFRNLFAYTTFMPGESSSSQIPGKIVYLGACLIAAVRLAREEKWDNSPRIVGRIADSVQLALRVWERIRREIPQSLQ